MECGNYTHFFFLKMLSCLDFYFNIPFFFSLFYVFFLFFHNDSLFWPCEPYQTKERRDVLFFQRQTNIYPILNKNELFKKKKKENKRTRRCCGRMCPAGPSLIFFLLFFLQPLLPCDDVTSSTLHTLYKPIEYYSRFLSLARWIYSWRSWTPLLKMFFNFFTKCMWFMFHSHLLVPQWRLWETKTFGNHFSWYNSTSDS